MVADVAIQSKYSDIFNHIERLRDSSHVHALSVDELNRLFTQSSLKDCRKSEYTVNVELEQQLQASFPTPDGKISIRKLITDDVDINNTGFNPELIKGNVHCSYPISIYVGIK
ncbi:Methyltransferase type 11 [Moritella viscosa]|nr:Methyltransferase type 11 [Moritella viscosa]SHO23304.1 Methyltransferase type 11 [Moritella viscosa]